MTTRRWLAWALTALTAACSGKALLPDSGSPVDDAGTSTFVLACPSPVGTVTSSVTYDLVASEEPAAPGDAVSYTLTPPDTVGNAPVPTTFISSSSTYAIPAGVTVDSATLAAASTANYTSVTVQLDAGSFVLSTTGNFAVNGSLYPVPALTLATHITAMAGATVTWEPPVSVVGQANAALVGTQTSDCTIENPSPLWVTHVVAK